MEPAYQAIIDRYPKLNHVQRINHLGILGTGNHFIEVCLDENENVWFLLHSGSRGVGNRFGTFFIELAKNDMRQWMINLPDQDLAYLPQGTEHFEDYVRAVHWAQDYALANRDLMMRNMIAAVQGSGEVPAFEANVEAVSCHHNYVTWEHHYGENVLIMTSSVTACWYSRASVCCSSSLWLTQLNGRGAGGLGGSPAGDVDLQPHCHPVQQSDGQRHT
jgi:tRNA-splicing ligase RtcB